MAGNHDIGFQLLSFYIVVNTAIRSALVIERIGVVRRRLQRDIAANKRLPQAPYARWIVELELERCQMSDSG